MAVNTGRVVTLPGGRASTRRRPQSDWQVFNPTDGFMPGRAACPARPANDCAGGGWRAVADACGRPFPVLAAIPDLAADARTGLPSDHADTFTALAGTSWPHARASVPGMASYITLLDRGCAVHELTFALLFLVIVAVPFRRRQRWTWWAAWLLMTANVGYALIFGAHDHAILVRSLVIDILLPVLLLAHIPVFFARQPVPRYRATAGRNRARGRAVPNYRDERAAAPAPA